MSQANKLVQIHPVLPSKDISRSIDYYVQKLEFELAFQDAEREPRYAGVRRDGVELHIQWHDESSFDRVERPSLRLVVQEIEKLYDEFKGRGVFHPRTALRDTAWGTREFAFFDLYGNGLTFTCDLEHPQEET